MMQSHLIRMAGEVQVKLYRVEACGGRVVRVWVRADELWPRGPRQRPGAGRRLGPVLREAQALLAKLAAAAEPVGPAEPASLPPWTGRMSGTPLR
jgi:hypothetical protein